MVDSAASERGKAAWVSAVAVVPLAFGLALAGCSNSPREPAGPGPASATLESAQNASDEVGASVPGPDSQRTTWINLRIVEVLADAQIDMETAVMLTNLLTDLSAQPSADPDARATQPRREDFHKRLGDVVQKYLLDQPLADGPMERLIGVLCSHNFMTILSSSPIDVVDHYRIVSVSKWDHTNAGWVTDPNMGQAATPQQDRGPMDLGLTLEILAREDHDAMLLDVKMDLRLTPPAKPSEADKGHTASVMPRQAFTVETQVTAPIGRYTTIRAIGPAGSPGASNREILLMVRPGITSPLEDPRPDPVSP